MDKEQMIKLLSCMKADEKVTKICMEETIKIVIATPNAFKFLYWSNSAKCWKEF